MDKPQEHDVRDMSLDEASIVEFDTIELEKENIQPIKSGRSAQALNHLFATSHADRANELALGHAKFQAELDSLDDSHKKKKKKNNNASTESGDDSGDNNNNDDDDDSANDPLDVYVRYVKWIIENYPQGGQNPESGLLPLLDRAIRRFKDDDLYKNDPRLYKLFSTYTAMVEDPLDVLKFMLANEIATQVAMYYEDYSDYLERGGELTKALEIVQLGIHRGAQPLQHLKRRLEELQARIEEQRLLDQLQQEESSLSIPAVGTSGTGGKESTSSRLPLEQGRRILGVKDSTSATSSVHANSTPQGHRPIGNSVSSRSAYISSSASPSTSTSSSSSSNRKPNSTKLTVFVDPTGEKGERAAAKLATTAGPSAWRDIGSQQVRRKENIQDPIPWKGVQYHQSSSAPTKAPIAKLKVYRDNDDANDQSTTNVVAGSIDGLERTALCVHTSMSETERIRKHPLSDLTDTECSTSQSASHRNEPNAVTDSFEPESGVDNVKKRPLPDNDVSRSEKSREEDLSDIATSTAHARPIAKRPRDPAIHPPQSPQPLLQQRTGHLEQPPSRASPSQSALRASRTIQTGSHKVTVSGTRPTVATEPGRSQSSTRPTPGSNTATRVGKKTPVRLFEVYRDPS